MHPREQKTSLNGYIPCFIIRIIQEKSEIICQRYKGSHDTPAWTQTLNENDTVPGFTFGSAVRITRFTMTTRFTMNYSGPPVTETQCTFFIFNQRTKKLKSTKTRNAEDRLIDGSSVQRWRLFVSKQPLASWMSWLPRPRVLFIHATVRHLVHRRNFFVKQTFRLPRSLLHAIFHPPT